MDTEPDGHVLRRWISVGDVLVMITSLIVIGVSFGNLATRVDSLSDDLLYLKNRDITPGAERRIAVLEAQAIQQRQDASDFRREVRQQLDRIEQKIDDHANGDRPSHPR